MIETVAIIGAGPVGLAAATHVLERGMVPPDPRAGGRRGLCREGLGHVPMFSNWRYNIDGAARRRLEATSQGRTWTHTRLARTCWRLT